jgi:hypothetical protein
VIRIMDLNEAKLIIEDRLVRLLKIILNMPDTADVHLREWVGSVDLRDVLDVANRDVGYNAVPMLVLDMALGRIRQDRGLGADWMIAEMKRLTPQLLATWHRVFDEGENDFETLCAIDVDGAEIELEPEVVQYSYDRVMDWVERSRA